jgi:hypothetical protein
MAMQPPFVACSADRCIALHHQGSSSYGLATAGRACSFALHGVVPGIGCMVMSCSGQLSDLAQTTHLLSVASAHVVAALSKSLETTVYVLADGISQRKMYSRRIHQIHQQLLDTRSGGSCTIYLTLSQVHILLVSKAPMLASSSQGLQHLHHRNRLDCDATSSVKPPTGAIGSNTRSAAKIRAAAAICRMQGEKEVS